VRPWDSDAIREWTMNNSYDEPRPPSSDVGLRIGLAVVAVLLACGAAGGLGAVVWFTTTAAERRQRAESEEQRLQAELAQQRRGEDSRRGKPAAQSTGTRPLPWADACTVVFVNRSGGPCKVTIAGRDAKGRAKLDADLSADGARMTAVVRQPVPYTIEEVTVEPAGRKGGRALNLRLKSRATYRVLVGPDGAAEVVEAPNRPG
jgi:hypothetical protein